MPLKFNLGEEEIARLAVDRYRLPGVDVEAELVRYYPYGALLAHAVGYVSRINEQELAQLDPRDYAGTHLIGKSGVEKFYETELHGEVGYENVETNARGRVLRVLEQIEPGPGKDLTLEQLWRWAQLKGVDVVATGDIAHPGWLLEMSERLEPAEDRG